MKLVDDTGMLLFPTYVNYYKFEEIKFLDKLKQDLLAIRSSMIHVDDVELWDHKRDSFTTPDNLHKFDKFSELTKMVDTCFRSTLDKMAVDYSDIDITCMWSNVTGSKSMGHHAMHNHPNSFLSCVFYVDIPIGAGDIKFVDPRPMKNTIVPKYHDDVDFYDKHGIWGVPVQVGTLLVFPSWLQHYVEYGQWNEGEYRISVSANMMPISDNIKNSMKSHYRKPTY